jgi:hypothetical protein
MRRLAILAALLVTVLAPVTGLQGSAPGESASAAAVPQLLAFRGLHFHLGGGGYGRSRVGLGGYGRRRSHGVLRRAVHALAFAYLLHLFFSNGGLSLLFWLLVAGVVVHFLRRRRRRRYSY